MCTHSFIVRSFTITITITIITITMFTAAPHGKIAKDDWNNKA
jgi:hypothetical protein